MFDVRTGNHIEITQGDTGALIYIPESDREFSENDYAVFTAKTMTGRQLVEITLQPDVDGSVRIEMQHEVTKEWPEGRHEWQIRYHMIEESGEKVSTPMGIGLLDVLRAV